MIGAAVYVLGTVRRKGDHQGTMQTPGLPDVMAFLPGANLGARRLLVWEAKTARGWLSSAQSEFRAYCERASVEHVTGGLDALIAWLAGHGYVNETRRMP